MFQKKGLLLAGLAAYAYYKYSKMSPESKKNLVDTIKDKAGKYLPDNLKNIFGATDTASAQGGAPEYGKGTF